MVRFYVRNADMVKTASFQLQADTGRGTWRERDAVISQASVMEQVEKGAGLKLNFDASPVGHTRCNRYTMCFELNGTLYNALDNSPFVARIVSSDDTEWDAYTQMTPLAAAWRWVREHPGDLLPAASYLARFMKSGWRDFVAARGRVNRISFFLHNFMDACHLEPDRIKACSFYTVTRDGPVSMCLANAKRDSYILQPVRMPGADGTTRLWDPLTGQLKDDANEGVDDVKDPTSHPLKHLKGRSRQIVAAQRRDQQAARGGSSGR